jgi:cell division protein FtsB
MRSMRLSGFSVVMLTLLVIAVIALAPSIRTFVEQQNQLAALRQAVEDRRDAVDDLNGEIARWDDPAYIEAQARDRLVYVYPGDITYLVIDEGSSVTTDDGAPISTDVQPTQVDWVRALLGTLVQAGTTTESAESLEQ